jgi:hypothetical protein
MRGQSGNLERLQELGRPATQRTNFERTRKLEGVENNELYRAFKLPALAEKIAAAIQ